MCPNYLPVIEKDAKIGEKISSLKKVSKVTSCDGVQSQGCYKLQTANIKYLSLINELIQLNK